MKVGIPLTYDRYMRKEPNYKIEISLSVTYIQPKLDIPFKIHSFLQILNILGSD